MCYITIKDGDFLASSIVLSQPQLIRLRRKFMEMPSHMLQNIAENYEIDVSSEKNDAFKISNNIINGLDPEQQKEVLMKYGDAGRVSTFVYKSRKKIPSIELLYPKARELIETDSEPIEYYPYVDEVEIDFNTKTLKIRFYYLHGYTRYIDRETGKLIEQRNYWDGVVLLRSDSTIMEIRAKHGSMANRIAEKISVYLGLPPFEAFSLKDEKINNKFVNWITSLNSATIEMSTKDEHASIIITANKDIDLRTGKKYHQELKNGTLQAGHVTIKRDEKNNKINFHAYFRDCHLKFTLFTSEENIRYVIDAIEKISEGYNFGRHEKILTEFFDKQD